VTPPTISPVTALTNHYSATAEAYEQLWAQALLPPALQLLDRLPLATARHVLDLGAGVGTLLPALKSRTNAVIVAADRSDGMVRRADATFPRTVADATQLPFHAASFDVAVLAFMLFHVPEPGAALAEVRRVLRAGGHIGLTTWGADDAMLAREIWVEELDRAGAPPAPPILHHDLVDNPAKVGALLGQAGFREPTVNPVAWSFRPSREDQIARGLRLGFVGRRLAALGPADQTDVLRRVRARLSMIPEDELVERGEVVAATAVA
jgi:SAM-dependent methyltransferase